MRTILTHIAACLYAAFLLALGILFAPPIRGEGFFGYALSSKSVIQWQKNTCQDGEIWVAGVQTAGGLAVKDWAKPGDCVGFGSGLDVDWVACCEKNGQRECASPVLATGLNEPCPVIFRVDGSMFKAGDVARWNAEHGGG